MKHSRCGACAGMVLVVLALVLAGCASMGGSGDSEDSTKVARGKQAIFNPEGTFTPEQEYYVGRTFTAQLLAKYPAYDAPSVNSYLNSLGQSLAMVSDMPETFNGYHFLALDSDDINAFGAPGGFVVVTRGMLRCARTEEEVAAILAHEIGHVSRRHALKAINASRIADLGELAGNAVINEVTKELGRQASSRVGNFVASKIPGFAGRLAGNAVEEIAEGLIAQLAVVLGNSVADMLKTAAMEGYSRDQEKEADLAAVQILHRVGYNPQALVRMLQVMKTRLKPEGADFAKTHPDPSIRIAYVEEAIKGLAPRSSAAKAAAPTAVAKRQARFKAALGNI
jgi:beta-barrel assembly-enhancing protease